MAQLMAQDVAQLLHVVVLVGQEQPRAKKTCHRGGGDGLADDHLRRAHAQVARRVREQGGVVRAGDVSLPAAHRAAEEGVGDTLIQQEGRRAREIAVKQDRRHGDVARRLLLGIRHRTLDDRVAHLCGGLAAFFGHVAKQVVGRLDGRLIRADKEGVVFRRRGLHRRVFYRKIDRQQQKDRQRQPQPAARFRAVALAPEGFEYQHRQNGEGT